LIEIHGNAGNAMREFDEFAGHDFIESVQSCDSVAQSNDRAHFIHSDFRLEVLNLFADDLRKFVNLDLCHKSLSSDCQQQVLDSACCLPF
jgi:hypothetical protein